MNDERVIEGGCLCGAVRYRVDGVLRPVVNCHCGQCRRTHGAFGPYTDCARADLTLLRDETLAHYRSSPDVRRSFCARCGSTLFWDRDGAPHISICAGTLDLPSGLSTAGHIYVADKADFYEIDDGLPRFEGSSAGVLDGEASN
ncbi:MAG: GFA family protein [Geminicoccaceae bacterium]|nr:GFA family protein [Geminicoccaceae bacterium]